VVGSLYAALSLRRQGQGAQSENEPPSEFAVSQQVTASYGIMPNILLLQTCARNENERCQACL
jgi:hypothetical protein